MILWCVRSLKLGLSVVSHRRTYHLSWYNITFSSKLNLNWFNFYDDFIGASSWHFDSCEVFDDEKSRAVPLGLLRFLNVSHSTVSPFPLQLFANVVIHISLYCTAQMLSQCCIVLYCTVLYCTVLYCTVLYCTVLYCTVLNCTELNCTLQKCTVLVSQRVKTSITLIYYSPFTHSFHYWILSFLGLSSCIIFTWYSKDRLQTRALNGQNSWRNTVRWWRHTHCT